MEGIGKQVLTKEFSGSFFQAILKNSNDLISIIDSSGSYKFVADSVKLLMGYEPEDLIGTNAFSYIHQDDQASIAAALELALSQNLSTLPTFRFRNKKQ